MHKSSEGASDPFPIVLAHETSVDNINIPPQIIQSENLSPSPSK